MSKTLFIADLHLCNERPEITSGFLNFLYSEAKNADALYILGDLFESWIGDDDPNPLHTTIANVLRQLSIPCYFLHGNRDLLLGQNFARTSGINLIPEEQVLELYGQSVLIMHGDTLCTQDIFYLRYRKIAKTRWFQNLFLSLPIHIRKKIALKIRTISKHKNAHNYIETLDVNLKLVIDLMFHYDAQVLIHGHTHRSAVHQVSIHGRSAQRLVLGDWNKNGSAITVSRNDIQLISFPL
ncbi:UDP-2,3-diacylglucosamine diphosphatase [Candidatus Erwinia haradaeae]|uniref:UDP-2,3-diacylglucosamine hydrolase n=1 Tax=Candidatus Erwinia haradaeae TaxID=1922217 RepID=A0A451D822_9GAMM|nr:UDP-2,3-diacylglucosamine diphosphatase [Candidatus Erwinia haradaeae]VFP81999.1 UDP-2,3-diacylglucosamine hydrolase [Candidatus Erwinia haradaeae]